MTADAKSVRFSPPLTRTLVHAYRACLLQGQAPDALALAKLVVLSLILFFAGHAFFYKLRKNFADVL